MTRVGARVGYLVAVLLGVTLLGFALFNLSPEATYSHLGKKPTAEQIAEVRRQFGYDKPLLPRYVDFFKRVVTLDFGESWSNGEPVVQVLRRTIPVSIAAVLPGFLLGNLIGLGMAMLAALGKGRWPDKLVNLLSVGGMSISFVVVMIAAQLLFASPAGWTLFPSRGWEVVGLGSYLAHVALPTLVIAFASFGYNARYYRSLLVNELGQPYAETARAFGAGRAQRLIRHILPNTWLPLLTRVIFSLPVVCVSGSLLIESFFGIPGIGLTTFGAVSASDQPVLQAVVVLSGLLFALALIASDSIYRSLDPRAFRSL